MKYKERLLPLILGFQAGEEAVTLDLLPLIMTMAREGRLEEEMFFDDVFMGRGQTHRIFPTRAR